MHYTNVLIRIKMFNNKKNIVCPGRPLGTKRLKIIKVRLFLRKLTCIVFDAIKPLKNI